VFTGSFRRSIATRSSARAFFADPGARSLAVLPKSDHRPPGRSGTAYSLRDNMSWFPPVDRPAKTDLALRERQWYRRRPPGYSIDRERTRNARATCTLGRSANRFPILLPVRRPSLCRHGCANKVVRELLTAPTDDRSLLRSILPLHGRCRSSALVLHKSDYRKPSDSHAIYGKRFAFCFVHKHTFANSCNGIFDRFS
jgi:hypothetical protein